MSVSSDTGVKDAVSPTAPSDSTRGAPVSDSTRGGVLVNGNHPMVDS